MLVVRKSRKFQNGTAYYWRTPFVFLIFIDDNLISPYIYRNLTVATVVSNSSKLKEVCNKMYFIMQNIIMTVNIVVQRQDLTDIDCVLCRTPLSAIAKRSSHREGKKNQTQKPNTQNSTLP